MVAIDKRRQAIDVIAVADELKVHGMLARLDGGQSYLNDLANACRRRRTCCTTRASCARRRRCGG
jgi:replicative DNA helicase